MSPVTRDDRQQLHGDEYLERFDTERQMTRVKRLLRHTQLPPAATILDVGCGTGLLAHLLSGQYARYIGADFSQAMIETAKNRAEASGLIGTEYVCGDARDVMARHCSSFDAIFMLDISEHVPDDEWQTIISSAHAALRPGGLVYLHTPNLEFFIEQLKHNGWMKQFPEHIAVRDESGNRHFFNKAGFSQVECQKLAHYNILRTLHPMSYMPLAGKYFAARLWITAQK